MDILTRSEELVMLAIIRLKKSAYLVNIRQHLMTATGRDWSVGAVFDTLDRLKRKGYLDSFLGDPTATRGGRSKRFYDITDNGKNILSGMKKVNDTMWEGYSVETSK